MPRGPRVFPGGFCYHVINRGNARARIFHRSTDYLAFLDLIGEACERLPMPIFAYCLMPNHFHMVLRPERDGDLSRWMQWLMTAQVRRHHLRHGSDGHLWQGRFKAFPIQEDGHLLTVLRYVERNALRAGLVDRAEDWPWGSLSVRQRGSRPTWLAAGPCPLPADWPDWVNQPQTAAELELLRLSVNRSAPFGNARWTDRVAAALGIEATLRPRGRPPKLPTTAVGGC